MSVRPASTFHYQLLPSAFKIAEAPTYICWKAVKGELWKGDNIQNERLKKMVVVVLGIGGYLGGLVALPITLCLSPVTLVADIVVGIVEYLFCRYHGSRKEELVKIAHRKIVVSTAQHLTFCVSAITALSFVAFFISTAAYIASPFKAIKYGLVFWTLGYAAGQTAVGQLPMSLNHHTFNIFIGGGSGEEENGTRWLDNQ